MAKIIVEIITGHKFHKYYKTFNADEVHVGRGLGNDLILDDPYVSAQHLVIFQKEQCIKIKDCSSKNGIYMPKIKQKIHDLIISSGDELVLGRTRIRIYLDDHRIAPAKPLHQSNKLLRNMKNQYFALFLTVIFLGMMLLEGFLLTSEKEPFIKLLPYPIISSFVLLFWAGIWTLIGRLIRHKIRFAIHVSIFCLWVFIFNILDNVNAYIGFYANSPLIHTSLNLITNGSLFILVLFTSLSFSTSMNKKSKYVYSILISLLIIVTIFGLSMSYSKYFLTGNLPYSPNLKPPVLGIPKSISIDQFMTKSDHIFTFKIKE